MNRFCTKSKVERRGASLVWVQLILIIFHTFRYKRCPMPRWVQVPFRPQHGHQHWPCTVSYCAQHGQSVIFFFLFFFFIGNARVVRVKASVPVSNPIQSNEAFCFGAQSGGGIFHNDNDNNHNDDTNMTPLGQTFLPRGLKISLTTRIREHPYRHMIM